jgi:hypothetical protein
MNDLKAGLASVAIVALGAALSACSSDGGGGSASGGSGGVGGSLGGAAGAGGSAGNGGTSGAAGAAGAGGNDGVLDPGVISKPSPGTAESESSVALAPDGRVAVAWINFTSAPGIGYAVSPDGGATFLAPVAIAPGASRISADPSLAVDAQGGLRLVWLEGKCTSSNDCTDGHVFVAAAPAGSTSFGAPVDASDADPSAFYDKPWIASMAQGGLIVSYARIIGTDRAIVVSRSTDGQSWTQSTVVAAPSGGLVGVPHLCVDPASSRVWVVYVDGASPTYTSIRWSDDGGATWPDQNTSQVGLTQEGSQVQSYDAKCVGRGDDVWVLYSLSSEVATSAKLGKFERVRLAHSPDRGATFDPPLDVNDTAAAKYYLRPEIALEASGALDIGYYAGNQDDDANGSFRWARRPAQSTSFGPSEVVHAPMLFTGDRSSTAWIGDYSGFTLSNGHLYVSYCDNSGGSAHTGFWRSATLAP